jgi:hypothetical protein
MVPPEGNDDAGVNSIVTGTDDIPTRRFCSLMLNVTKVIWPRIGPDAMAAEGTVSADDWKVVCVAPGVTPPIVMPPIVIVVATACMVAPAVVMTNSVEVVGPHVAVRAATLLEPRTTVGVTDGAKKTFG